MNGPVWSAPEWAEGIRRGDRAFIGRALSLVESYLPADKERAAGLFDCLGPPPQGSFRLGITGNPGAGKSTLTEALGLRWAESGVKVAVLAVDPSSSKHRGSILGDKTRMEGLSRHPNAFIRPTASGGQMGGVAASTREAIQILEHAGYQRIVLETVGVGQNETDAINYVDGLLLLALPNAGDEVQGIKRGIMECADLVAVNKCDGAFAEAGQQAAQQLSQSLGWFSRSDQWIVPVLQVSALEGSGLDKLMEALDRFERWTRGTGEMDRRRAKQRELEWESSWDAHLRTWASADPGIQEAYREAAAAFAAGQGAAAALAAAFRNKNN